MNIKKMTACFGALENETLELRPGLNVICARNESGKSTWCAFIRAMLYGIDSSQREKNGVKPDKVHFAPWSGAPMSGEMELEYSGRDISISRRTKLATAPMREFSAVYTGTAEPVPGLNGKDAGLVLTGMPKAVFESSVFVRQSGLNVDNNAELEKRLAAIVSTGEESGSYTEADTALRAWQRKRKYNRAGAIPVLESEIAALDGRIARLEGAAGERDALERRLKAARKQEAQIREASLAGAEKARGELAAELEKNRQGLRLAEREYTEKREKLLMMKAELDSGPFGGMEPEQAEKEAGDDVKELETLKRSAPKRFVMFLVLALGVLTAILGAALLQPLLFVSAACFLAAAVLCFVSLKRNKSLKYYENYLLRKYGCAQAEEVKQACTHYAERFKEWTQAEDGLTRAGERLEKARQSCSRAENALLSGAPSGSGNEERLRHAQAETAALERQLAELKGKFSELGDPMVLKTELEDKQAHLDELQAQYDALGLAITTLREANEEMQLRFSPELSRRASEIMSDLTGGRYDRLVFDKQLDARARLSGDTGDHELSFLSAGTADQLYLALRLAICDLALPEDKSCPLILDDALVNFDDARMAQAIDLLAERAKGRQIILFTCHDREERYLRERAVQTI